MNNLPNIYKGNCSKSTNKKVYYSKEGNVDVRKKKVIVKNKDIGSKIDDLFKNSNMNYTDEVKVILKDRVVTTRFIKKIDNYILTIDNERINYNDILDIEV